MNKYRVYRTLAAKWLVATALLILPALALPHLDVAQEDSKPLPLPEGTIKFSSFNQMEWRPVIEEYAQQAGLNLQLDVAPPTGVFDYQSSKEMTFLEGLDFLNKNLAARDRVLIRDHDTLVMFDTTKGIREDMVETVKPEELATRGKYEILKCEYDLKGLDPTEIRNQIEPLVSDIYRRKVNVFPAANLLVVQETGLNLRFIYSLINTAKEAQGLANWNAVYVELKHIVPEDVTGPAESALKIRRDTMSTEDGSLTLSYSPLSSRILATGEPDMIAKFEQLVRTIDIEFDDPNAGPREAPYYMSYRVQGSAELMHDVLQSMLAGRPDINLDFDEASNRIHLRGRKSDHEAALEVLNKSKDGTGNVTVVQIKETDIDDLIDTLEDIFGLGGTDAPEDAPSITEIPQNRVAVRGKPNEVAEIVKTIGDIDIPFQRSSATRLPNRFVRLDSGELSTMPTFLNTMVPTMGLQNEIKVVMPGDEPRIFFDQQQRSFDVFGADGLEDNQESRQRVDPRRRKAAAETMENSDSAEPAENQTSGESGEIVSPKNDDTEDSGDDWNSRSNKTEKPGDAGKKQTSLDQPRVYLLQPSSAPRRQLAQGNRLSVSLVSFQQQEETNGSGKTSTEQVNEETSTTQEIESVPGAPVTIRITPLGIALQSEDLEALDALEDLIMQELGSTSSDDSLALFLLKHRDANEAKQQLESYLGIGGGGGGGGVTDLMGGFMRNTMGGAGELLGGLLGGGGGAEGGSGAIETAGPVGIVADVKNFSLLVSALPEDMIKIRQLVELIDQPTAIQHPNAIGRTRTIPVFHKDVTEVETMVRSNLAAILRSSEQAGQGNSPNDQQEVLRALLGRNGGGNGAKEQETPKAAMSIDEINQTLVVTGPEFLYEQILDFVELVDIPSNRPQPTFEIIQTPGIDPTVVAQLAQLQNPGLIEVVVEESTGGASSGRSASGRSNARGNGNAAPAAAAMGGADMGNVFRQLQQAQQRANRRGNQGGGTRGGGGGTRGGGDGANRGGGGGGRPRGGR